MAARDCRVTVFLSEDEAAFLRNVATNEEGLSLPAFIRNRMVRVINERRAVAAPDASSPTPAKKGRPSTTKWESLDDAQKRELLKKTANAMTPAQRAAIAEFSKDQIEMACIYHNRVGTLSHQDRMSLFILAQDGVDIEDAESAGFTAKQLEYALLLDAPPAWWQEAEDRRVAMAKWAGVPPREVE